MGPVEAIEGESENMSKFFKFASYSQGPPAWTYQALCQALCQGGCCSNLCALLPAARRPKRGAIPARMII